MSALECVAIVLVLIALWQYSQPAKPAESFGGEAPRPYTPMINGPAWAKLGSMSAFENADTPNRAGTLLHRMGMEDSGNKATENLRNRNSGIGRGTNWTNVMNY